MGCLRDHSFSKFWTRLINLTFKRRLFSDLAWKKGTHKRSLIVSQQSLNRTHQKGVWKYLLHVGMEVVGILELGIEQRRSKNGDQSRFKSSENYRLFYTWSPFCFTYAPRSLFRFLGHKRLRGPICSDPLWEKRAFLWLHPLRGEAMLLKQVWDKRAQLERSMGSNTVLFKALSSPMPSLQERSRSPFPIC